MKKIFDVLLKPSRLILIIAAFAYAGLFTIAIFGGFGGGFLPVVANLIIFILTVAAVVAIPVLLLLKKEEAAKIVFLLVAGYWLISESRSYLSFAQVTESENGLVVANGVFGFLAGLALVGVLVLLVLHFILKKEVFKFCAVLTFAGAFLFIFVFFILELVLFIKYENGWTSYVNLIADLIAPVGVFFGYLYFLGAPEFEFKKGSKSEEAPSEQCDD